MSKGVPMRMASGLESGEGVSCSLVPEWCRGGRRGGTFGCHCDSAVLVFACHGPVAEYPGVAVAVWTLDDCRFLDGYQIATETLPKVEPILGGF